MADSITEGIMLSQDVLDIKKDQEQIIQCLPGLMDILRQMLAALEKMVGVQETMAADLVEIKKAVQEPPPDTTPVSTVAKPGIPTERS
jgi:hypothetical protein